MRLLVTGGTGFLGRHVVRMAIQQGHDVVALARSATAVATLIADGARALPGDLDDPVSTDDAFTAACAHALLNVASLGFGHAPTIVAAAEGAGLTRAVFVSTTAVATGLPAASKRIRLDAEDAIRTSGLDWTIVRPTMIYGGPGDRNMARLLRVLRRTPVLPIPGGGAGLQQPVHVEDLAAVLLTALDTSVAVGKTYDIAGPDPLTMREIIGEAGLAVGRRPRVVSLPLGPAVTAARVIERIVPHPRLRAEQLQRLAEDKAFPIAAATAELDYQPRSFQAGISAEAALV